MAYNRCHIGSGSLMPRLSIHHHCNLSITTPLASFAVVHLRNAAPPSTVDAPAPPLIVLFCVRYHQAKQIERSNGRAERMSRLKEVAIGQHTESDVRSAVAKLTEVSQTRLAAWAGEVGFRFSQPDDKVFLLPCCGAVTKISACQQSMPMPIYWLVQKLNNILPPVKDRIRTSISSSSNRFSLRA